MNHLDLFSGILGFSEGFRESGIQSIGYCENNKFCQSVIKYKRKDPLIISDVREISKANIPIQPDIISAGVPCQDVSVAGQRSGLDGKRTGLFFEFVRIVQEFQSLWIVFENVPGLLSSNEKRDFARVVGELGECGYFLAYRILDSQYWGVAQRRRRVFIVGSFGNTSCVKVLFESEGLPWNPQKGRKKRKGVAPTIGARTKGGGGLGTDTELDGGLLPVIYGDGNKKAGTVQTCWRKGPGGGFNNELQGVVCSVTETGHGYWNEGKPRLRCTTAPSQPQNIICFHGKQDPITEKNLALGLESTHPVHSICFKPGQSKDSRSIGCEKEISPTLEDGMGGNNRSAVVHPLQARADGSEDGTGRGTPLIQDNMCVRRLTPRECERLQGFEDDWTRWGRDENGKKVEISDTQRYKMLGNAVTVNVSRWIGKRLMQAIKQLEV